MRAGWRPTGELLDLQPARSSAKTFSKELGNASLTETLSRIADASHRAALARHQQHDEAPRLRETISECDTKIVRYRATLDAG